MGSLNGIYLGLGIFAYLLGSIPFGYLIAKGFYGVDIRTLGSGNPGATNVWRSLGKKPGISTLMLDILKGVIPVLITKRVAPQFDGLAVTVGLLAIAGHNWSLFLRGGGGKGVATSAGVFLALIPVQAFIALLVFLLFFFISRRVSVGSMTAAIILFLSVIIMKLSLSITVTVGLASLMLLIKHIPNMKRIAAGTEPKVNFK